MIKTNSLDESNNSVQNIKSGRFSQETDPYENDFD